MDLHNLTTTGRSISSICMSKQQEFPDAQSACTSSPFSPSSFSSSPQSTALIARMERFEGWMPGDGCYLNHGSHSSSSKRWTTLSITTISRRWTLGTTWTSCGWVHLRWAGGPRLLQGEATHALGHFCDQGGLWEGQQCWSYTRSHSCGLLVSNDHLHVLFIHHSWIRLTHLQVLGCGGRRTFPNSKRGRGRPEQPSLLPQAGAGLSK